MARECFECKRPIDIEGRGVALMPCPEGHALHWKCAINMIVADKHDGRGACPACTAAARHEPEHIGHLYLPIGDSEAFERFKMHAWRNPERVARASISGTSVSIAQSNGDVATLVKAKCPPQNLTMLALQRGNVSAESVFSVYTAQEIAANFPNVSWEHWIKLGLKAQHLARFPSTAVAQHLAPPQAIVTTLMHGDAGALAKALKWTPDAWAAVGADAAFFFRNRLTPLTIKELKWSDKDMCETLGLTSEVFAAALHGKAPGAFAQSAGWDPQSRHFVALCGGGAKAAERE